MFAGMDMFTLMIFALVFVAGAYFAGVAMDGVMEEDGFGQIGNMVILLGGALVGIYVGDMVQWTMTRSAANAVSAVAGGFVCLTLLAIVKNFLIRAGF